MAKLLHDRYQEKYEMIFVFANTSREKEETLVFVANITKYWGIPITWVEAIVHHNKRKGSTYKVVNFETAKRDGSVFEEVIKKYGIPNTQFPHCTRELKTNPIRAYMKSIGWGEHKKYTTAIGYRFDEPGRVKLEKALIEKQYYPLYEWKIAKADVLQFFKQQPFDLGLMEHQGNCRRCYKKTDRKILTQALEAPNDTWVEDMERKYSMFTPPSRTQGHAPYYFFRENRSMADLRLLIDEDFLKYSDTNKPNFDFELDQIEYGGCAESCEPF